MENLIGKRLDGRYEVEQLVGVGGMANVYKATDLSVNKVVAVKVLRDEFLDNEDLVRRFKNESKAVALLSHPNIVKVFDVNFSESVQYIVMEFIDGITLKQYIDVQKPLSWKDTVHFTTQILRALQHAHDRGIVHRDIKPQNIMLLSDGSIKVMDFGIARFSRSETRTITDKAIGSVHYISPEQARGDITDAKADIYSVGIIMYEMLTGTLPFESDTPVQVAIKQISDTPRSPREVVADIPEGLEEITLKAMTKDPAMRYQSASHMLRDIDDFKKNPSIVFEYKYFSGPDPAQTVGKIKNAEKPAENGTDKGKEKKTKQRRVSRNPNFTMYTVLAVTAAVVICTLLLSLFSLGMFDGQHEEVVMPTLVGQVSGDVMGDPQYGFRFVVAEDSDYNAEYAEGTIYRQSPMPGMPVKDNTRVTLYVSRGIKMVTLPNVQDWSWGEAVEHLRELGVQVLTVSTKNTDYDANIVMEMEPTAGETVEAGTIVTLHVNMYGDSRTFTVPNVVGMPQLEGYTALSQNGLIVGTQTRQESGSPAGTIIAQSINAGSTVSAGTIVDLVISSGTPTLNHTLALTMPSTHPSYTVKVVVRSVSHGGTNTTSGGVVSAGAAWSYVVAIPEPCTIEVYLQVGGVEELYATFTASNVAGSLALTSVNNNIFGSVPMYTVTASSVGDGSHGVSPEGTMASGTTVTITPVLGGAATAYTITINGVSAGSAPTTYVVTGNTSIVVTFT